ncbi:alcohol dehydrogenase [Parafrankia colletiae]|uniref:Alcohol dehydrogenase n=1 Tax=Parafrankia colletiae TaxID=573497 RepID=A0A1S1QSG8_9ACTN|nr:medium chain dehydrogenase/reductase family protein [Parafrankia colletiae]MCK9901849.1 medium chain dehydrogenase/reductase family protein [Frankia sp. Cpl3]OHV36509.1 alcohol dehydrogenase [Parafrankia colletiae]
MPRAIVFKGDETWDLREVPKPALRPGFAVLRVEAVGICHSDVDQFRGHAPVPSGGVFPTVPGHEIVGRIEEITPEAEARFGVREGDRVGVRSVVLGPAGSRVYGFDFPLDEGSGLFGGYADYMELAPGSEVHKLRDDLPATELTVYECLTNAITWIRAVQPGQTLVVEGPGHMGLAAIVGARAAGAGKIIVTGLSGDRLRLDTALRVGADHAIDVENEDVVARVAEITGGAMADVVLDAASGNPVTLKTAMQIARTGATIVAAGMKDRLLDGLDVSQIPLRHLTIAPGGGLDLAGACTMINEGKVPTGVLHGASFPLEQFEDALALADRRVPGQDAVRVSLKVA